MIKITGILEKVTVETEELSDYIGKTVQVHGSIYKIRKMTDFAFVLLRAKREIVQCIYSKEISKFPLEELEEESCVKVTAYVQEESRSKKGYDLLIQNIEVLSIPHDSSPIVINNRYVDASIEKLLDFRPITLRNEKERGIFKVQEGIVHGIREFLKKEAFLAQSPQFYKQMLVGVYERVFEIAPVFRAEKHSTSRHLNEYTSVDFEMGYINSFEEIMQTETMMLRYIIRYLEQNYQPEINLLKIKLPVINEIPAVKFIEVKELIAREYHREIKDNDDFEPEEEKLLCKWIKKETGSDFVFVTCYPSKKRPFYAMENKENREETLSFDLLFRGIEITTGGQRIHSYQEQIEKMKRREMDVEQFESYLMMHKYGMPPHGGLGLGLERFTSRLLEQDNVRLSTLFPRDINRLVP